MRNLGISYLTEGMKLGRNIYKSDGTVLLGKDIELKKEYIDRLPSQGITSIYVECDNCKDIVVDDIMSETLRLKIFKGVKSINDAIAKKFAQKSSGDMNEREFKSSLFHIHRELHELSVEMVEEFQKNRVPMINLIDSRLSEDYIYAHMTNVAALSIYIGIGMGYDYEKLVALAKGCLVHDIGIILSVPMEIRNKTGQLSESEINIVRQHPEIGYSVLRKMEGINILSAHVAYQHHERFNGEGYPRKLKQKEITEYAYIAGIADVYDAITNNRVYKQRITPDKAREFLMVSRDLFFPAYLVDKFLEKIPPFPIGMSVILSNGATAVVSALNKENLARPVLRVISDIEGKKAPYEIDMMKELSIMIEKVLN